MTHFCQNRYECRMQGMNNAQPEKNIGIQRLEDIEATTIAEGRTEIRRRQSAKIDGTTKG